MYGASKFIQGMAMGAVVASAAMFVMMPKNMRNMKKAKRALSHAVNDVKYMMHNMK